MRKTKLALLLFGGILLSSCATTPTVVSTDVASVVADAIAATETACSFIPAATTIADIISVGDPLVATAGQIATAICNSIKASVVTPPATTTAAAALKRKFALHRFGVNAPPTVDNVIIVGTFVK
jgi:hypothetical protein